MMLNGCFFLALKKIKKKFESGFAGVIVYNQHS